MERIVIGAAENEGFAAARMLRERDAAPKRITPLIPKGCCAGRSSCHHFLVAPIPLVSAEMNLSATDRLYWE
jgi:hypothetical protein